MRNKIRILIVLMTLIVSFSTLASYASGYSFTWRQGNFINSGGHVAMEKFIGASPGGWNHEIVFKGTATSPAYGEFKVKIQRKNMWWWEDVSHQYNCAQDYYGRNFSLFWSVDEQGTYRVILFKPTTRQVVTFTNVEFYRR